MAHKKGAGSTDNGRDSMPKYLGVKKYGGQFVKAGNILVRQRGTKFHAGENVYMGKDHTLHAFVSGIVNFKKTKENRRVVYVSPEIPKINEVKEVLDAPAKTLKAKATVADAPAPAAVVETPVVAAPVVEAVAATPAPAPKKAAKGDDLKKIEGIGPKIEQLLHEGGITTFAQLAQTSPDLIKVILDAAGPRFAIHNPTTWPKQAELAAAGKWDELKAWQDELDGGK